MGELVLIPQSISMKLIVTIMAVGGVCVPLVLLQYLQRKECRVARIATVPRMFCSFVGIQSSGIFKQAGAVVTFDFIMHFPFVPFQPFERAQCDIAFAALVLGLGSDLHCAGGGLDGAGDIVSLGQMFGLSMTVQRFL